MNIKCENCGAPLTPIEGKDYLFCDYCYSFYFPKNENNEKVKIISEDEKKLSCPVCDEFLVGASIDGVHLMFCKKCQGILLKQKSFQKLVSIKRENFSGRGVKRRKINLEELERNIDCPLCGRQMDTHPYFGPGGVVIDNCFNCNLIWLDHDELSWIEKSKN